MSADRCTLKAMAVTAFLYCDQGSGTLPTELTVPLKICRWYLTHGVRGLPYNL